MIDKITQLIVKLRSTPSTIELHDFLCLSHTISLCVNVCIYKCLSVYMDVSVHVCVYMQIYLTHSHSNSILQWPHFSPLPTLFFTGSRTPATCYRYESFRVAIQPLEARACVRRLESIKVKYSANKSQQVNDVRQKLYFNFREKQSTRFQI